MLMLLAQSGVGVAVLLVHEVIRTGRIVVVLLLLLLLMVTVLLLLTIR